MTYQEAKDRVAALSPHAYIRPDSLTKRGDTLIARRAFAPKKDKTWIGLAWAGSVKLLFPEAKIKKTSVDRKHNARCWIVFD